MTTQTKCYLAPCHPVTLTVACVISGRHKKTTTNNGGCFLQLINKQLSLEAATTTKTCYTIYTQGSVENTLKTFLLI